VAVCCHFRKSQRQLASVFEVSIVDLLLKIASTVDGLEATSGTERGYPDVEFSGLAVGNNHYAVDVKVARGAASGGAKQTESRITLYTGNTYFLYPDLRWPGTFRRSRLPFAWPTPLLQLTSRDTFA
jgi:hypothetical protein